MSQDGLYFWGGTNTYPTQELIKVSATNPLPTTGGGGGGGGDTNITEVGGVAIALGQTVSASSFPVTIASDQSLAITGSVTASGSVTLLAGSAIAGKVGIDQTTDGTTNAVHLVAGTAIAGKVGIDQTTPGTTNAVQTTSGSVVTQTPATSGGLSMSSTLTPNNNTAVVVKASAGQLYHVECYNNSAVIAYVKFYNATSATAGSGTPVWRTMIPAPAAGGGGGFVSVDVNGLAFGTGITYVCVTDYADNGTTAPAANAYIVNVAYK